MGVLWTSYKNEERQIKKGNIYLRTKVKMVAIQIEKRRKYVAKNFMSLMEI